jgi:hypothetical protein
VENQSKGWNMNKTFQIVLISLAGIVVVAALLLVGMIIGQRMGWGAGAYGSMWEMMPSLMGSDDDFDNDRCPMGRGMMGGYTSGRTRWEKSGNDLSMPGFHGGPETIMMFDSDGQGWCGDGSYSWSRGMGPGMMWGHVATRCIP